MTRARFLTLALLCLPLPALAETAAQPICVTNGTQDAHLFAAEAKDGTRVVQTLDPRERLCVPSTGRGTVAAFDDIDSIEGCTRLASPGIAMELLEFADFDRCRWQDQ